MYYRELKVWQKSMDLVIETYQIVRKLPREELYALSNQMRRSAVSVPSNIAEGAGRKSTREYIHFLKIARGSLSELETQLLICCRLNYIRSEDIQNIMLLSAEIGKMINAILFKLSPED